MCFVILALCFVSKQKNYANTLYTDTTAVHELTIYVFAPEVPIQWSSPSALYYSAKRSFIKRGFNQRKTFLGHMVFVLKTSLLEKPLYASIVANSKKQMLKQVFFKKIGLGVLGFPFKAKMEPAKQVIGDIKYHTQRKNIAFITYRISENSAKRIVEFFSRFQKKFNEKYAPADFYGGDFWPLYEFEGAGCSSLCLAALEAGGISPGEKADWKTQIKIPMKLIGGDMNNRNRVSLRSIKKTKSWYSEKGKQDVDFVNFEIVDPFLVMKWIQRQSATSSLYRDVRGSGSKADSSILKNVKRNNPSLFIKQYYKMAGITE